MNMATLTFDINFCVQCRTKCETIRESPCSLVPRYFVSSPLFSSFSRIIFLFFVWFLKFPLRPYIALVKRFHFERYTFYKYPYLLDEEASRTLHIPCASWPVNAFVDRFVHSSRLFRCCFCHYELRMRTSNCRKRYLFIGIERSFSSTPEQIRRTRSRRKMTFGHWWKTYQTKKSEFLSFHRLLLHDNRVSYWFFRSLAKLCCNCLRDTAAGYSFVAKFPKNGRTKVIGRGS